MPARDPQVGAGHAWADIQTREEHREFGRPVAKKATVNRKKRKIPGV
jgi:hypothetical protein